MRNLTALLIVFLAAALVVSACAKNQESSSSTSTATSAEPQPPPESPAQVAAAKLPIPLAKLPSLKVAPGNASAGAQVFSAQCESCHGAGGKNGQVGPTLAGTGLKAGQVAYMVRNPQGVDKTSGMPKLNLTDKQVSDVAAYVASLK